MVTAFTPMSYASLKFAKTGLGSRLFAEDPNAPSAADAAGGGVGGALPSALAPFAALVAGRQALLRRDEVREQIAITENDLNKIKSDLANADTLISVSSYLSLDVASWPCQGDTRSCIQMHAGSARRLHGFLTCCSCRLRSFYRRLLEWLRLPRRSLFTVSLVARTRVANRYPLVCLRLLLLCK
jgi:hypothetical protein